MNEKLAQLVKELFDLTDKVESNDEGFRYFKPNQLSIVSCRTMDAQRLDTIIHELRTIVGVGKGVSESDVFFMNFPDVCRTCRGSGVQGYGTARHACEGCGGSGSTDPTVCKACRGLGTSDDGSEVDICLECNGLGEVKA